MSQDCKAIPQLPRSCSGTVILGVISLLLILDSLLALARGWRTQSRMEMVFIVAFATMAILCGFAIASPRCRALISNRRVNSPLLILTITCLGLLIVGEFTLWLFVEPYTAVKFHKRAPNMSWSFAPNPQYMAGVSSQTRFTTNSDGIRGLPWPPRDQAYRILCVGGSTTECVYLDDEVAWPSLLMTKLNTYSDARKARQVWVGNIGISGYSAADHLKFAKQSDLMSQIDCGVFLCGLNDFQHALRDPEAMKKIAPYWEQSRSWRFILDGYLALRQELGFVELIFEDREGQNYERRRRIRATSRVCNQLPDLSQPILEYRHTVEGIIQACRLHHVRPVFVCQPTLWREGLSSRSTANLWMGMNQDNSFMDTKCLRQGIEMYNEALRNTCKALGVECIETSSMDGSEGLFYDDAHFNDAGSRILAELIAVHFFNTPF